MENEYIKWIILFFSILFILFAIYFYSYWGYSGTALVKLGLNCQNENSKNKVCISGDDYTVEGNYDKDKFYKLKYNKDTKKAYVINGIDYISWGNILLSLGIIGLVYFYKIYSTEKEENQPKKRPKDVDNFVRESLSNSPKISRVITLSDRLRKGRENAIIL